MCEIGFTHPENKLGIGAIYLFEHGGQRFPDFWKDDIVLDAKYKRLAINGDHLDIDREDVHQIMAYMYRLKAPRVVLYVLMLVTPIKLFLKGCIKIATWELYLYMLFLYQEIVTRMKTS